MPPLPPPVPYKLRKDAQQPRTFDRELDIPPPESLNVRDRTYSTSSTRGAFYPGNGDSIRSIDSIISQNHQSRRRPKRNIRKETNSAITTLSIPTGGSDQLVDAASQAIESLGGSIDGLIMGGPPAYIGGLEIGPEKFQSRNDVADTCNKPVYNGYGAVSNGRNPVMPVPPVQVGAVAHTLTSPSAAAADRMDAAHRQQARQTYLNQSYQYEPMLVNGLASPSAEAAWMNGGQEQDQSTPKFGNQQLKINPFASVAQADCGVVPGQSPHFHEQTRAPVQRQENKVFASLQSDYNVVSPQLNEQTQQSTQKDVPQKSSYQKKQHWDQNTPIKSTRKEEDAYEHNKESLSYSVRVSDRVSDRVSEVLDAINKHWLIRGLKYNDEDDSVYFDDEWSMAGLVRHFFYNPVSPEFTSLQQFCWAVLLGIMMGFYTATWKTIIEFCVDFVWVTVPGFLVKIGVFTELDGRFPLYHYMWLCPTVFGCILSYIFAALKTPIPGQNEWINAVHTKGVQDHATLFPLFVLSTMGMASGMSLGPELPLVLTAGMIGSWLGLKCNQSMLSARVLNLTAASAAVGGFFGFPMAGALFVLEIPHRMGLQYFEALSPATIASIVAVLFNRIITGDNVTGYYKYPFLTSTLPSQIFTVSIVYGFFGAGTGILYAYGVIKLKGLVHDLFHKHSDDSDHHKDENHEDDEKHEKDEQKQELAEDNGEKMPLVKGSDSYNKNDKVQPSAASTYSRFFLVVSKYICCVIPHEPYRAAVAGTIAGFIVGITCMFVPHVTFWGEAQLQTLIDRGHTPLPVFGRGDEPTADLLALGHCLIDHENPESVKAGFSIQCSAIIAIAKIFVTGLSLGTGIVGGHFWGPLFTGCIASHFFTDSMKYISSQVGIQLGFTRLHSYPCVAILCIMGSTHVVTFRAHMAIMLILTLTISAFQPEDGSNGEVAGDYSAVFPLLVVAVFLSLMASRKIVFYKTQRSRGDIMALPEVLCEPGKEGNPLVIDYDDKKEMINDFNLHGENNVADGYSSGYGTDLEEIGASENIPDHNPNGHLQHKILEGEFQEIKRSTVRHNKTENKYGKVEQQRFSNVHTNEDLVFLAGVADPVSGPFQQKQNDKAHQRSKVLPEANKKQQESNAIEGENNTDRLDELLKNPSKPPTVRGKTAGKRRGHRHTNSAPILFANGRSTITGRQNRLGGARTPPPSGARSPLPRDDLLVSVSSVGLLSKGQPSLMEQARHRRAPSDVSVERARHRRAPSLTSSVPSRGRLNSDNSVASLGNGQTSLMEQARHRRVPSLTTSVPSRGRLNSDNSFAGLV